MLLLFLMNQGIFSEISNALLKLFKIIKLQCKFLDFSEKYDKFSKCSEKLNDDDQKFEICLVHYNLAVCFQQTSNNKESIKHNRICLEMNSGLENPKKIDFQIKVLYNLAVLHEKINRLNEANAYKKQAQVIFFLSY